MGVFVKILNMSILKELFSKEKNHVVGIGSTRREKAIIATELGRRIRHRVPNPEDLAAEEFLHSLGTTVPCQLGFTTDRKRKITGAFCSPVKSLSLSDKYRTSIRPFGRLTGRQIIDSQGRIAPEAMGSFEDIEKALAIAGKLTKEQREEIEKEIFGGNKPDEMWYRTLRSSNSRLRQQKQ